MDESDEIDCIKGLKKIMHAGYYSFPADGTGMEQERRTREE